MFADLYNIVRYKFAVLFAILPYIGNRRIFTNRKDTCIDETSCPVESEAFRRRAWANLRSARRVGSHPEDDPTGTGSGGRYISHLLYVFPGSKGTGTRCSR